MWEEATVLFTNVKADVLMALVCLFTACIYLVFMGKDFLKLLVSLLRVFSLDR